MCTTIATALSTLSSPEYFTVSTPLNISPHLFHHTSLTSRTVMLLELRFNHSLWKPHSSHQLQDFFPAALQSDSESWFPLLRGFTITLRRSTLVRTLLDKCTARYQDLYLTTYNTHNRETSMSSGGFEPAIPKYGRPQFYALDQCFSTFVRPQPGKFFFIRRVPGPNKFTRKLLSIFLSSYIKLT